MVTSQPVAEQKTALRRRALSHRKGLAAASPEAGFDLARYATLLSQASIVSAYLPIRHEIDPLPLAHALTKRGAVLALPAIADDVLHFRLFDPAVPLVAGPFGTREAAGEPVTPDLVLVPLLAFDRTGARLGYGKAYYDRWLAAHPSARPVGVAYAGQEVDAVPTEPHDVRLALILTEAGPVEGAPACV